MDNKSKLLDLIDDCMIDKDYVIAALLGWISEDEVIQVCAANDIQLGEEYDD